MKSGNITFSFNNGNNSALPVGFRESDEDEETDRRPYIYCYPPPQGLQAKVVSPHLINLEAMRTVELELNSGRNDIKAGIIRVRPATAGLRLRISEVEVVEGGIDVTPNIDAGTIEFTQLPPQRFLRLRIPYTVEKPSQLCPRGPRSVMKPIGGNLPFRLHTTLWPRCPYRSTCRTFSRMSCCSHVSQSAPPC